MGRVRTPRRAVRRRDRNPPGRYDEEKRRSLPRTDPRARILLRLGPRSQHDRSGILQVDAVDLRKTLREESRLRRRSPRQLVPRSRNGAGQRGSHRRQVRARQPPGRSQTDAPVDAAHNGIRRASPERARFSRLARGHQGNAAQLDRKIDRRARRFQSGRDGRGL